MPEQIQNILLPILEVLKYVFTFVLAFLAVLWLALVFWTFRDIQTRTRDIIAYIFAPLLVLFIPIVGIVPYLLTRPKETLAQAYERALQEEYMLQDLEEREICPTCRVKVQPDFMFCYNCRTKLRKECLNCNQPLRLKWTNCPFCGVTNPKSKDRLGGTANPVAASIAARATQQTAPFVQTVKPGKKAAPAIDTAAADSDVPSASTAAPRATFAAAAPQTKSATTPNPVVKPSAPVEDLFADDAPKAPRLPAGDAARSYGYTGTTGGYGYTGSTPTQRRAPKPPVEPDEAQG